MHTNRNNDLNASCTDGMAKDCNVRIIDRHFLLDADLGTPRTPG